MPKRWEPLIAHPEQIRLITEVKRFKVVPAGRRSGKTERFKRTLVSEAMKVPGLYFAGAPTYSQVKKIYWKDLKALVPDWFKLKAPSETDLIIYLKNGSEIHLIGFDKPARFEGQPWTGGGIDEIADIKSDAWDSNISPALDTEGLDTWCWLLGVPDGLNHYYELAEYARTSGDSEWGLYTWKSSDILSPSKIEAAKRRMDPRTFRQEYEASFETATGVIYSDYCDENHTDRVFKPGDIHWTHDFNFLPMSSAICQTEGDIDYIVDEIILDHAIARDVGKEFVERYKGHENCMVYLYGDPSGRAGEKHGQISNYIAIEDELRKAGFRVERRVLSRERSIRDSQSSLRGRVLNSKGERRLYINPKQAPTTDRGMKTAQLKKGSTFLEDDTNRNQHVTTALRYMTEVRYPALGKATITIKN